MEARTWRTAVWIATVITLSGCSEEAATPDSDGASSGGVTASGGASSGGVTDSGGASSGGVADSGGASSGGVTASGGSLEGSGGASPEPSSGCGALDWPPSGPYTIDVNGTEREYIITLPDGYDGTRPTKLVFVWHGLTGTMEQTVGNQFYGYFGLKGVVDTDTILVAGQGLPSAPGETDYAWRDNDDEDTAFTSAMIDRFTSDYCIDEARIFSTGMSYGGVMSNETGCDLGDRLRAIAPIAGAGPGFGSWGQTVTCRGQVAALLIHGSADEDVLISSGEGSRDHWLAANGCDATAAAVTPTEYCVTYSGCAAGFPVTWCVHDGGHTIPSWSAQTIWDFFRQF